MILGTPPPHRERGQHFMDTSCATCGRDLHREAQIAILAQHSRILMGIQVR